MDERMTIASWSGGKDSCLALYKAMNAGLDVRYLLNFISRETKRCCFHGIESPLLNLQTSLLEIPVTQRKVSPDMEKYEEEFKEAVSELMKKGAEKMVFGDVYLDEHRDWVQRVCNDLSIEPIEPLWGMPPVKVVEEFIDAGFEAIVVSCKADIMGEDFLGRRVDREFVELVQMKDICPCGENGEFHTFVVGGPMFNGKIKITKSRNVLKEGFWKHWFMDIQEYEIV